jgi:hypothetical protein
MMQRYKRERIIWQIKNRKLRDAFFFTWKIFLGVGKSQDFPD